MGGWHLRMTCGLSYASLHSEPVSALGLLIVWSLWGTPGMAKCERCQLCLQDKSRSTKWRRRAALGHWFLLCLWSVVGRLIVYQDGNYLYPVQYRQTICWSQIRWYPLEVILMAWPSTFLESRPWWGHDCGKFITIIIFISGKSGICTSGHKFSDPPPPVQIGLIIPLRIQWIQVLISDYRDTYSGSHFHYVLLKICNLYLGL